MSKLLLSLAISFIGVTSAQAVEISSSIASIKNQKTSASGSLLQIAVTDAAIQYGMQTKTIANSSRNQVDVNYNILNRAGFNASVGLGDVTQTNVKSHLIFQGSIGYTYDFTTNLNTGLSYAYSNDFSNSIKDKQNAVAIGVGYKFAPSVTVVAKYGKNYGDSKENVFALSCVKKF